MTSVMTDREKKNQKRRQSEAIRRYGPLNMSALTGLSPLELARHFDGCSGPCQCQVWCNICAEMHRIDFMHAWQIPGDVPLWVQAKVDSGEITKEQAYIFAWKLKHNPTPLERVIVTW